MVQRPGLEPDAHVKRPPHLGVGNIGERQPRQVAVSGEDERAHD